MEFSKISQSLRKKNGKFDMDLMFILAFYDAYIRERSLKVVAEVFGMRLTALMTKIATHPELQQAKAFADEHRNKGYLGNYVVKNLSKEARAVWNKIQDLSTQEEIDAIFKGRPLRIRQQLFCTAVLYTGFDLSKATSMIGINRGEIDRWKKDPDFLQMLEEIQFHKKNFFEKALIGLVHENHPGAIIFVNRTYNRDRGYSDQIDLNVHAQEGATEFSLEELISDMDLPTQKKLLAAIEKRKLQHEEEAGENLSLAKVK